MSSKSVKLVEFECRGCEFTEFKPDVVVLDDCANVVQGEFSCQGEERGTKFENIDLSELSWYDYDEKVLCSPTF